MSLDLYCERVGPGLWAEPLNVITNLAFLLAAWAASALARRRRLGSNDVRILVALCAGIGLGSGLFHTAATARAQLLDVIPILLFQVLYLWVYGRRIARMPRLYTLGIVVFFVAAVLGTTRFLHLLNGSVMYFPAWLALLVMGIHHRATQLVEPGMLLAAAGLFTVSLLLRTVDNTLCPVLDIGTHFLWHIFNGMLLYLLLRALIIGLTPAGEPK